MHTQPLGSTRHPGVPWLPWAIRKSPAASVVSLEWLCNKTPGSQNNCVHLLRPPLYFYLFLVCLSMKCFGAGSVSACVYRVSCRMGNLLRCWGLVAVLALSWGCEREGGSHREAGVHRESLGLCAGRRRGTAAGLLVVL